MLAIIRKDMSEIRKDVSEVRKVITGPKLELAGVKGAMVLQRWMLGFIPATNVAIVSSCSATDRRPARFRAGGSIVDEARLP